MAASIEHFELFLEDFNLRKVRLHLAALLVEVVKLVVESSISLSEVSILDVTLNELNLANNVLIEVLHMHLHADDLGDAELPANHALVLVPLHLFNLSVDLPEHFLEGLGVVDHGSVAVGAVGAP